MKINLKSLIECSQLIKSAACSFSYIFAIFSRHFELFVLPTFREVILNFLDWCLKRQINQTPDR